VDNSPTSWAPRSVVLGVGWLVTVAVAAAAVFSALSGDPAGSVLFGLATLAIGAFSAYATLIRPRLVADFTGIRVRTMSGTVELSWAEARVRLRTTRRLGRDAVTLEVESDDHLLILGQLELGEDPRDVLDVLSALRAHG
jgi:hypothetical protein